MFLKKFTAIKHTDNGYMLDTDGARIMLVFMSDDIIRIRVSFDGTFPEHSVALVRTAWSDDNDELLKDERERVQALQVPYTEDDQTLTFCTATLKLVLHKEPLYFAIYNKDGVLLHQDLRQRAFDKDYLGRLTHYSTLDYAADHFFGFGEKTGYLDKKGKHMRMSPKDAIGQDPEHGEPLYKHVPFYIKINEQTGLASGLFYHNSYDCIFDMGNERSGYFDSYSYYQTEGGDLDIFFLNGPSVKDVISHYTFLTGRPAMPVKESLGYTASTMYYAELERNCDEEIYKVIKKHRKAGINIDNFWLASGYSAGEDRLRYTFNWNLTRFPDPDKFVRTLHEQGINVIPNLKPGVLQRHPYLKFYEERDALIKTPDGKADYVGRWWGGPGRFVDFTGPKGRNAWKELLKKTILDKGVYTVWNDNCEYDGVEDRAARVAAEGRGGTMAEYKILQSNMMAYTAKEALQEEYGKRRQYIISRAGFAGIQRYAQVWSGDNLTCWPSLKFNIATLIGMGLSGMVNTGCDIGGFAGPAPEAELLLRWIQNGVFQPRFCINSANNDNTVTQPFMYESVLPEVRHAWKLRYMLFPYLYSLMREAHLTGLPVMRPLFMEFPEDRRCLSDTSMSFMFGSAILVANVLEKGACTRKIYLPAGCTWYLLDNHLEGTMQAFEGGQDIELPVTLDSIPMFLREGSLFIHSNDIEHLPADSVHTLKITGCLRKDGTLPVTWYEDDNGIRGEGNYHTLNITARTEAHGISLHFKGEGPYQTALQRLELNLVQKDKGPLYLSLDGRKLQGFIVGDEYEAVQEGYYYDMDSRSIRVKFDLPENRDDFTLFLSQEKFDLIGMENNG